MRQDFYRTKLKRWDTYFFNICNSVSRKSPCLSRQIGAILVRDYSIVSTGYNGPPRGVPHCGHDRFIADELLSSKLKSDSFILECPTNEIVSSTCPRRVMKFESGEGMEWCPAQHAEENAVSNAARLGISTIETTLYMNSVIPCNKCFGTLINAGVVEVVVVNATIYDRYSNYIIKNSNIKIRTFEL